MDRLLVTGGARLAGTVQVSGAKNSALKLMAASLLAPGRSVITNVPRIRDCAVMAEMLEHLGVVGRSVAWRRRARRDDGRRRRGAARAGPADPRLDRDPRSAARAMRSGARGAARRRRDRRATGRPARPRAGADGRRGSVPTTAILVAEAPTLHGASITLDYPSVTATENLLLAAVLATGTTVIDNAAREPEIADLAAFLTAMGAAVTAPAPARSRSRASTDRCPARSTPRSPTGSRSARGPPPPWRPSATSR